MGTDDSRGVSTVLGIVLLVAVVLAGVTTIAAVGAEALADREATITAETARADLGRLAQSVETVTATERDRTTARVATDSGVATVSTGRATVAVGDGDRYRTVVDTTLGGVGHERGDSAVVYQSGGVFTVDGGSATVVRAPPITVVRENATSMTLPLVSVSGDGSIRDRAVVETTGRTASSDRVAVPADQHVRVTIESQYVDAWRRTFERVIPADLRDIRTDGESLTVVVGADRTDPLYLHTSVHDVTVEDG